MTSSNQIEEFKSLRIWKYVTLVALFLASFAIFINVALYVRQKNQLDRQHTIQVLNCLSNRRQDNSLSRLVGVAVDNGISNSEVRKEFKAFINGVKKAPKCPPPPRSIINGK